MTATAAECSERNLSDVEACRGLSTIENRTKGCSFPRCREPVDCDVRRTRAMTFSRCNPKPYTIPCVAIEDQPQFPWRGLTLDPDRHFMTKEFIERYVDLLKYHQEKMTVLFPPVPSAVGK